MHECSGQGFTNFPIDNLYGMPLIRNYIIRAKYWGDDVVVVSPDAGGAKRADVLAKKLGADFALFSKQRKQAGVPQSSLPAFYH